LTHCKGTASALLTAGGSQAEHGTLSSLELSSLRISLHNLR
jgi:hypothetical protein